MLIGVWWTVVEQYWVAWAIRIDEMHGWAGSMIRNQVSFEVDETREDNDSDNDKSDAIYEF